MDHVTDLESAFAALPRPDLIGERPSSEELQAWVAFAERCLVALRDAA